MAFEELRSSQPERQTLWTSAIQEAWGPPTRERPETSSTSSPTSTDATTPLTGERLQSLSRDLTSDNAATRTTAHQTLRSLDPAQAVGFLGSENYRDREAATRVLQEMGPRAINALETGSRANDLETARRSQQILGRLDGQNFDRLVSGMRDADPATRQAAELRLSRMSTDTLLQNASYSNLSGRAFEDLSSMVRNRLSNDQIRQLYLDNGLRKFGAQEQPQDEAALRRRMTAQRILGEDTRDTESQLGAVVGRTPGREAEAESMLRRSLQGQNIHPLTQIRADAALADLYSRMPGRAGDARTHFNSLVRTIGNDTTLDPKTHREVLDRFLTEGNPLQLNAEDRQRAQGVRDALQRQIEEWNRGGKKQGP